MNKRRYAFRAETTIICTERGPDIVRIPYIGQKRTISGTISEGLDIPMVVMLFICYVMI